MFQVLLFDYCWKTFLVEDKKIINVTFCVTCIIYFMSTMQRSEWSLWDSCASVDCTSTKWTFVTK